MEHYNFLTPEQNDALHYANGYLTAMQRNESHYRDHIDIDTYQSKLYLIIDTIKDSKICPEDRFDAADSLVGIVQELHAETAHLH